jgi:hypothetical protein
MLTYHGKEVGFNSVCKRLYGSPGFWDSSPFPRPELWLDAQQMPRNQYFNPGKALLSLRFFKKSQNLISNDKIKSSMSLSFSTLQQKRKENS